MQNKIKRLVFTLLFSLFFILSAFLIFASVGIGIFIALLFIIIAFFVFLLLIYYLRAKYFFKNFRKNRLLKKIKSLRAELLALNKAYFKRELSNKEYNKEKDSIMEKLISYEASLKAINLGIKDPYSKTDLILQLITDKYLSKDISESLFKKLYTKYKRKLIKMESEKINEEIDRQIRAELRKLKRNLNS